MCRATENTLTSVQDLSIINDCNMAKEASPRPKHNLDIAKEILQANGIQGRGMTMLGLSLVASLRESASRSVLEQKPGRFNTDAERSLIEKRVRETNTETVDPLWTNKEVWESRNFLSFDYLQHTFTGRRDEMVKDAQVVYLMSALTLGSWGKTRGQAYTETVESQIEAGLQGFARRTANAKDWNAIVAVSREFAESPLAEQVHNVAEVWNEDYFNPSSKSGDAIDDLLETYIVIKRPDAVMNSAKQIYKAAFGLDLDQVRPVEIPSYYRHIYSSGQQSPQG